MSGDRSPLPPQVPEQTVCLLRELEGLGYSVAYFLLKDESLALEATRVALLEASLDPHRLRAEPPAARQARFGKLAARKALAVRAATMNPCG